MLFFLIFSKAFDLVCHHKLIFELKMFLRDTLTMQWLDHYLSDLRQFAEISKSKSSELEGLSGVSEGSVWGPLFFQFLRID